MWKIMKKEMCITLYERTNAFSPMRKVIHAVMQTNNVQSMQTAMCN